TSAKAYKANLASLRAIATPLLLLFSWGVARWCRRTENSKSGHGRDGARFRSLDPLHAMRCNCYAKTVELVLTQGVHCAHGSSEALHRHPNCTELENSVSELVEMRIP